MGFITLVVVYIIGGLTFIPLVICAFLTVIYHTSTTSHSRYHNALVTATDEASGAARVVGERVAGKPRTEPEVAAGYFAVTREWTPGGLNGKPPEKLSPSGTSLIKGEEPSQSMYQTMVRSIFDRRPGAAKSNAAIADKGKKRAANVFYVVLRHGHLMLYDDSDQLEVRYVISLNHHHVSIYGGGEEIPEGELYIKRNAIALTRKEADTAFLTDSSQGQPFYLFNENCSEKEDFYFALLRNQDRSSEAVADEPPSPLQYDPAHLILLVQQLHSSEDHLQTRWINAIVGRLFLALYKTPEVKEHIKSKITKKIARVKKPAFLNDISIQKVDVGDSVPYITNPRLRDLTVEGECVVEANISYSGNAQVEIFTAARIDLGARFKTREVNLILAASLKKLEGKLLIRIKPPPSNRIWISFETMPKMEINIEPIVSTRQITYRPILQLIENRIREVFAETLVYPHFDDIPFTDTIKNAYRGGVWEPPVESDYPPDVNTLQGDSENVQPIQDSIGSPDKSISMPNLTSTTVNGDKKKFSSSVDIGESGSESSTLTHRTHRKPRTLRASSFTQLTAPQPVVSTEAVNATYDRSRSASNSSSPKGTPVGSPSSATTSAIGAPKAPAAGDEDENEDERPEEFYPALELPSSDDSASTRPSRSQSIASSKSANTTIPSSPPSIYGGGSRSFTNTVSPMSTRINSGFSTSSSIPEAPNKPVIGAAINTAAAAVKKWYTNRKPDLPPRSPEAGTQTFRSQTSLAQNSLLSNSISNSSTSLQPPEAIHRHVSPLPPPDIPPPPPKRTAPIAVPKRKTLPPPVLPARNKPRGQDDILVVAAPAQDDEDDSEPSTPPDEFMVSLDGNTVQHHPTNNGLTSLGNLLGRNDNASRSNAQVHRRKNSGIGSQALKRRSVRGDTGEDLDNWGTGIQDEDERRKHNSDVWGDIESTMNR